MQAKLEPLPHPTRTTSSQPSRLPLPGPLLSNKPRSPPAQPPSRRTAPGPQRSLPHTGAERELSGPAAPGPFCPRHLQRPHSGRRSQRSTGSSHRPAQPSPSSPRTGAVAGAATLPSSMLGAGIARFQQGAPAGSKARRPGRSEAALPLRGSSSNRGAESRTSGPVGSGVASRGCCWRRSLTGCGSPVLRAFPIGLVGELSAAQAQAGASGGRGVLRPKGCGWL